VIRARRESLLWREKPSSPKVANAWFADVKRGIRQSLLRADFSHSPRRANITRFDPQPTLR
jgi:hypothetical protein